MARFGSSQDASSLLAGLYSAYESRLTSLAERGEARALEDQNAEDQMAFDEWEAGELSDAEWLAYVQGRIEETATRPEEQAQWREHLRESEHTIAELRISETAEDLVNDIEAGTRSWDDLLSFYQRELKALPAGSPLAKQIRGQMEEVTDRVRTNRINAEFERVGYQFEAGQISGRQAGAQLRNLAAQFRDTDPTRYWQILSQAAELERFGGLVGSGGRGGGGGGGGSSAALRDALELNRDRIMGLSAQFKAGEMVGWDPELGEIPLRNPDGTPTDAMRQIDEQALENYSALYTMLKEDGNTAAGTVLKEWQGYITDHIQPRNSIAPEMQAGALLQQGLAIFEQVSEAGDPVREWNQVQRWASQVAGWERRLNVDMKSGGRKLPNVAPGIDDTATQISATERDPEDRTTAETTGAAASLAAFARDVRDARTEEDVAMAVENLRVLIGEGDGTLSSVMSSIGGNTALDTIYAWVTDAVTTRAGVESGQYVRAFVTSEAGTELVWVPTADGVATVIDPETGQPVTVSQRIPVDPKSGNPIYNAAAGQRLTQVMVEVDGGVEAALAVVEPMYFIGGTPVTQADYTDHLTKLAKLGAVDPESGVTDFLVQAGLLPSLSDGKASLTPDEQETLDELTALGAPSAYERTMLTTEKGTETWLFDGTSWHRERVRTNRNGVPVGGVPAPFIGRNAFAAQRAATEMGFDPSGVAYHKTAHHPEFSDGGDWYQTVAKQARTADKANRRSTTISDMGLVAHPQFRSDPGMHVSEQAQKLASSIGIKFGSLTDKPEKPATRRIAPGIDDTIRAPSKGLALPKIDLPQFALPELPNVVPPPAKIAVNLPKLSLDLDKDEDDGKRARTAPKKPTSRSGGGLRLYR